MTARFLKCLITTAITVGCEEPGCQMRVLELAGGPTLAPDRCLQLQQIESGHRGPAAADPFGPPEPGSTGSLSGPIIQTEPQQRCIL